MEQMLLLLYLRSFFDLSEIFIDMRAWISESREVGCSMYLWLMVPTHSRQSDTAAGVWSVSEEVEEDSMLAFCCA
jgi:hypothetical protein